MRPKRPVYASKQEATKAYAEAHAACIAARNAYRAAPDANFEAERAAFDAACLAEQIAARELKSWM
jgi:hypothetical protein